MPKYTQKMREMMAESIRRDVCLAGMTLLSEGGWSAFTTENIAKKLGVSRGVLYNYFKDKNDILYAITRNSISSLCDDLEGIASNGNSAASRLSDMAAHIVRRFEHLKKYHRAIIENVPPPKDPSHPLIDGHRRRNAIIEGVIRDGIEKGEFIEVDVPAAMILFCGSLHEICILSDFRGGFIDPAPSVQLFLRGIQKQS